MVHVLARIRRPRMETKMKQKSSQVEWSPEALAAMGEPNLVYVREVLAADVLADVDMEFPIITPEKGAVWYAVHAADGERIAVLEDRDLAFAAARGNDLKPVSVH